MTAANHSDIATRRQENENNWQSGLAPRSRRRSVTAAHAAWEPTKTVEFIVPAGTGGGADQMARVIQSIIAKHNLMKQSMVVVNKGGGAGAEGFLDVKGAKGDPHKIIITLSNLFTTPLATGVPFNWRDLTPVEMMALDQFVLWVNAEALQDGQGLHRCGQGRRRRPTKRFKMAGTGSKQEDQIITVAIEQQDRHQVHLHPVQGRRRRGGAAGGQARGFDGEQPDRGGGAVARAASCGRCACSIPSACRTRPR